jgi:hypothetical protein
LNVAGCGFKQPAVLDMADNERLHARITRKLRSERILRIFFKMNLLLPGRNGSGIPLPYLCSPISDNLIALQ